MRRLRDKTLVILAVLGFFCSSVMAELCFAQTENLDSSRRLRKEIQILNLLNGLYLTDGQMEFLLEQAKRAQGISETYREKYHQYASGASLSLERLKGELMKEQTEVSEDIAKAVHHNRRDQIELKSEYEKEVGEIVQRVKNSLTDNQLYGLKEFKPCLVPPRGPARIGQAEDHTGGIKRLERIRSIPEDIYAFRKEKIATRILDSLLAHRQQVAKDIDKQQALADVLSVFDEARSLSDIDFDLQKEELAKKFRKDMLPETKTIDLDTKIKRFLLDPTVITVLEARIVNKDKV